MNVLCLIFLLLLSEPPRMPGGLTSRLDIGGLEGGGSQLRDEVQQTYIEPPGILDANYRQPPATDWIVQTMCRVTY